MGVYLVRTVKKKNGDVAETNFPVTVRKDHGFTQYFYSPHGFWVDAATIGKQIRQFDGSVIVWSLKDES